MLKINTSTLSYKNEKTDDYEQCYQGLYTVSQKRANFGKL